MAAYKQDTDLKKAKLLIASIVMLGSGPAGFAAEPVAEETVAYVSDKLTVPLRSGPSTSHRILHRGLPSGTALQILSRDDDAGFVQVLTARGMEGWLPTQYLSSEPIARDRLVTAIRQIADLRETVAMQSEQLAMLGRQNTESSDSNAAFTRQVQTLEQDLAEIKRVSASAIELSETNLELTELNNRLRSEVDNLVSDRSRLEENVQERWLLIGGGLVLVGLLGGVAIKSRPRRSAWS
jgi:SH3 domain protein